MPGDPRSGAAAGVERIIDGAADELVLVVEAGIDLVQAARLGAAFPEPRPIVEPLARRAAVAAAGELAETVHAYGRRLEAELEAVDLAEVWRLRARGRGCERQDSRNENDAGSTNGGAVPNPSP